MSRRTVPNIWRTTKLKIALIKTPDCSLADVWSAHLDRTQNKEAEECRQLSEQTSFLPCKKNTCRQRRTQSPIIVPLSLRSSNCSEQSISTASNTRAEVTIFIWQQCRDGKLRKKFLSDEEANELFTRLASARAERTAKSQIQWFLIKAFVGRTNKNHKKSYIQFAGTREKPRFRVRLTPPFRTPH